MMLHRMIPLLFCAAIAGCGDDGDAPKKEPAGCSVANQTGCAAAEVCEEVEGGQPTCFAPVTISGRVFDAIDQVAIGGAHVIARDANDAAISRVAITEPDGTYTLIVPAKRDANGATVKADVTLRADANGYETFPKAPRVALPIDLSTAAGTPPDIASAATDIALIPLPNPAGLGSISGVVHSEHPGGTLVVAGGVTGAADFDGAYTVFNIPAGAVTARGYAAGVNLDTADASVQGGQDTPGVDLHAIGDATAVVSGKVAIVNAPGGAETSVILVVEETFNETAARGEAPLGLRQGNVSGDFAIEGVPDGNYVVLAAFENDGLVRDPDTSIGGTEIVHITVSGSDLAIADGFKVTEALDVVAPGANELEEVSGTPTFEWTDDSSEGHYELRLFDALGTLVWEDLAVPEVSGSATVTVSYGGPALDPGMIYQFRATSISKASGGKPETPISQTEDLKGVFVYK